MEQKRRTLSVLLLLALLLGMLPGFAAQSAQAADPALTFTATADKTSVNGGDAVTVTVSVTNNTASAVTAAMAQVRLSYETDVLASNGDGTILNSSVTVAIGGEVLDVQAKFLTVGAGKTVKLASYELTAANVDGSAEFRFTYQRALDSGLKIIETAATGTTVTVQKTGDSKPYILTMAPRMDDGAYAVNIQLAMKDGADSSYQSVIAFGFKISYPTDMFTLSSLKLSDALPAGSSGYDLSGANARWNGDGENALQVSTEPITIATATFTPKDDVQGVASLEFVDATYVWHNEKLENAVGSATGCELVVGEEQDELTINCQKTMTYGETQTLTAAGGSGSGDVTYEVKNGTGAATVDGARLTATKAGTVTVTATKAGGDTGGIYYASATATAEITIGQATPKGGPSFDYVDADEETTLEAAKLSIDGIKDIYGKPLDGTIAWDDGKETVVESGTAYGWTFTPTDSVNYTTLTGEISPARREQAKLSIDCADAMVYGGNITLSTIGGSGSGAVTYEVTGDTGAATVDGAKLTATKAGTVTVTATKAGSGLYAKAVSEPVTITISKATPTGAPSYTVIQAGQQLWEADLSFGSIVLPGKLAWTKDGAGNAITDATEAVADTEYWWEFTPKKEENYESLTGFICVGKGPQETLRITSAGETTYGEPLKLTYTGGSGDGEVTYKVLDGETVATVSEDGVLTPLKAGTVTVTVTKAGGETYADATATKTVVIKKAMPVVTPTLTYVDAADNLTLSSVDLTKSVATGVGTDEKVDGAFSWDAPDTVVTMYTLYGWTFTPSNDFTDKYTVATGSLAVAKQPQQALTITSSDTMVFKGEKLKLTYTGGDSKGEVTWSVEDGTGSASWNANAGTLTANAAGTVTVTATKASEGQYLKATATQVITIEKATPTGTPSYTKVNEGRSLGDTNLQWIPSGSAAVSGTIRWDVDEDETTVEAGKSYAWTFTPASEYSDNFAELHGSIIPSKKQQKPGSITSAGEMTYGETLILTAASGSGTGVGVGAVTWSVTDNGETTELTGSALTPTHAGSVTVTATWAGDATYGTATATKVITVKKAQPTGTPTYSSVKEGDQLSKAGLAPGNIKGVDGKPLDGRAEWDEGDSAVAVSGITYHWTFTPTDTDNYTTLSGSVSNICEQQTVTPSVILSPTTANVTVGSSITLTATTVPPNATVTWSSSNTSVATVANGVVTGVAAGSATITATITVNGTTYTATCAVTVSGGAVTPSVTLSPTATSVTVGNTVMLTATTVPPNATVTWSSSDTSVATVANGVVTGVAVGTATITAKITVDGTNYTATCTVTVNSAAATTYTVAVNPTTGGTIRADRSIAAAGETVTLTATPDAGYQLVGVSVTGATASGSGNTRTFTMPTSNVTVTATFEKINYNITTTVTPTADGTVTADKTSAQYGDSVTLTVTPDAGYQLSSLTVDGQNVTAQVSNGQYRFTMPASNVTVTATFTKINYTVTLPSVTGGTVTADKTSANYNDTVTLTVAATEGYRLTSLTVRTLDGQNVTTQASNGRYTFTMPASNVTVTATFTKINYTVTLPSVTGGTVTADKTSANYNDTVTLTVAATEGYRLTSLTVRTLDGQNVTTQASNGRYTFTMPASNVTVTATFGALHTVTVSNGKLADGTTSGTYAEGESVAITANEAGEGQRFKAWTYEGELSFIDSDASNATATFTMPTTDVALTATYETIPTETVEEALTPNASGEITVEKTDAASVTFSSTTLTSIKGNENATSLSVTVENNTKLTFNSAALNKLTSADDGVTLNVSTKTGAAAKGELNAAQKTAAEARGDALATLDVSLTGVDASDLGEDGVQVSIPYTATGSQSGILYIVWYVEDDGTMTMVNVATYANKTITFSVPHFSRYVVTAVTPGVTLDKTEASVTAGSNVTLTATPMPAGMPVTWTSSNTSAATVANGVVTGVAAGTATITATITVNGKSASATCAVTVNAKSDGGGGGGGGTTSGSSNVTIGTADGTTVPVEAVAKSDGKGGYSADIDAKTGAEIVNAAKNGMTSVLLYVTADDAATAIRTTLTADTVKSLASDTKAALTVMSAVGTVTLSSDNLADLARNGGDVSIGVTSVGAQRATVAITADGKSVDKLADDVKAELPKLVSTAAGSVLVKVNSDGSEETLTFSTVSNEGAKVLLTGSADVAVRVKSTVYPDVADSHWAKPQISFVAAHGILTGGSNGNFEPNKTMTRAETAQALYNIEKARGASYGGSGNFTDVESFRWYSEAAGWAKENGVMSGYANGSFGAGDHVTRVQAAQILYNYVREIMGMDVSADVAVLTGFADQSAVDDWAAASMSWAVSSGLMNGRVTGEYDANGDAIRALDPAGDLTRGEMSALMERFVELVLQ